MAKKKKNKGKGKKKLAKQLTKQLKKVIKVHGPEIALGFVTGLITKLLADKTGKPKKSKKNKKAAKPQEAEEPTLLTSVKETTQAVADKVKAVVAPKPTARKAPVRRKASQPVETTEPAE